MANPVGRACASPHLLSWRVDEKLRCIVVRGEPTLEDIEFLLRAIEPELTVGQPAFASLVDIRGIGTVEPIAYERFGEGMAEARARLAANVSRSVILHSGGPAAALLAGYTRVLGEPWPVQLFDDPIAAIDALGRSPELLATLDALAVSAFAEDPRLAETRRWLLHHTRLASLRACAAALGTSTRSLQRRLGSAGSSFRRELERARVTKALELLRHSDAKLHTIARAVGYAQERGLAEAIKRQTGRGPADHR